MFNVANFTPWVLFTDLGIILGLLLIGKIIRVKVRLVQKLFIPPSLLAGLLGLIFGPMVWVGCLCQISSLCIRQF
jgi:ESS family glutamate:Na+ symporter